MAMRIIKRGKPLLHASDVRALFHREKTVIERWMTYPLFILYTMTRYAHTHTLTSALWAQVFGKTFNIMCVRTGHEVIKMCPNLCYILLSVPLLCGRLSFAIIKHADRWLITASNPWLNEKFHYLSWYSHMMGVSSLLRCWHGICVQIHTIDSVRKWLIL